MASLATSREQAGPSRVSAGRNALVRFARTKPLGALGGLVVLVMLLAAIFAQLLAPFDPDETKILDKFQAPSATHPLGTDNLGRDIYSRVIFGARLSLLVAVSATVAGSLLGGLVGLFSAYSGRSVDIGIQRVADVMLAFPNLILLLALVAALGPSVPTVIVALAVGTVPRVNRLVRSVALTVKELTYVEAARALGASQSRIIARHLAPNCVAPWLIFSATLFGQLVLAEATLAFLGLGVPPPTASWGRDLTAAQRYFLQSPWMAIWPGVAMSLVVFGANLLGDSLRDTLDPKLRGRA